jgi:CBS domain-containing protein
MRTCIEARTVREVMTASPVTVRPNTGLRELKRLFETHDYNAFPVVDEHGGLRGLVTKLDFLRLFCPDRFRWIPDFQVPGGTSVDDIMARSIVAIEPTDSVVVAADRMIEYGVRSIPVVERRAEGAMLVGIVSRKDLLGCLRLDDESGV